MSDDVIKYVWKCVALFFCVIALSVSAHGVLTSNKSSYPETEREIKACSDGGGSYIHGSCIKLRCFE